MNDGEEDYFLMNKYAYVKIKCMQKITVNLTFVFASFFEHSFVLLPALDNEYIICVSKSFHYLGISIRLIMYDCCCLII